MGAGEARIVGRGPRARRNLRARRRRQSSSAHAAHARPVGRARGQRRIPPCVARTDAHGDGGRRARVPLGRRTPRRPRRARRHVHAACTGGERHAVPADDDVRGSARAARACRRCAGVVVAAEASRVRLRSATLARARQACRADRHGHDRAPGGIRRPQQPHPRARPAGRNGADHRTQVVLLGTAVRCAPGPRARRRPRLLPGAAVPRRRLAQHAPSRAPQGQARQPLERVVRSRVRRLRSATRSANRGEASQRSSRWCDTRASTACSAPRA